MPKLLFMINSLYGGGAERVLQTILANLDLNHYAVTVYSMHTERIDPAIYDERIRFKAVFADYQGNSKMAALVHAFFLKVKGKLFSVLPSGLFYRIYMHEKCDVEIAFIEGESTKILSGSNQKTRKLAWVHIDLIHNPWTAFLYKNDADEARHYRNFDQVICVSDAVREAFLEKYALPAEQVITQHNPIDTAAVRAKAMEACELPPHECFRMISAGRLVLQKGYDRLLRILFHLHEAGFAFELHILGEGEERASLEAYIKEHGMESCVTLTGYMENPYCRMKNADLYVCSSRAEGFSTTILEALVLGIPVISTDCAGVRELFGDAACGQITENSEEALETALRGVFEHPERLASYKEEAVRRGQDFSLSHTMKEIEALFTTSA